MTITTTLRPVSPVLPAPLTIRRSAGRRFVDAVVLVVEAYLEARAMRRAMRDLSQLDDRMLADIGVARSGIESAVRGNDADVVRTQPMRRQLMQADFRLAA